MAPGPPRARIRGMRAHEAPAVGRLTLSAYDAYGHIGGSYRDHLGDPDARRRGATAVLVAELGGEVVGTVTLVLPGDAEWEPRPAPAGDAGLRMLAVAPWAEGRGIGRALVEACLQRARALGARRVVVTTMDWMTRAHHLYRHLGFRHRPDLDVRFPSGVGHALVLDLTEDAAAHFPPPGAAPADPPSFEEVWSRAPRPGPARPGP